MILIRPAIALTALLALSLASASTSPQAVLAHKERMNQAQDLKYVALDAFAAADVAGVAAAAAQLSPLLEAEIDYWAGTGLGDIEALARINLQLANRVAEIAGQGDLGATATAWAELERSCSGCHDLHPERRVRVVEAER